MLRRIFTRNVLPSSLHSIKTAASITKSNFCRGLVHKNAHLNFVYNVSHNIPCRFYSKDSKFEDLVVDFQDVRKATSDGKILIVDVREPDEIKEHGKIPNSINIPLGSLSSVLSTMPDAEFERTYQRPKPTEETEIIFYCMIGKRSGMAQQNAFNLGFKNVKNYVGSWTDWANKTQ